MGSKKKAAPTCSKCKDTGLILAGELGEESATPCDCGAPIDPKFLKVSTIRETLAPPKLGEMRIGRGRAEVHIVIEEHGVGWRAFLRLTHAVSYYGNRIDFAVLAGEGDWEGACTRRALDLCLEFIDGQST